MHRAGPCPGWQGGLPGGATHQWKSAKERGPDLGVRAMRTISGCIVRAPAQIGEGVYWEVPRISGSPQKSAGQITGGGRERAFGLCCGEGCRTGKHNAQ